MAGIHEEIAGARYEYWSSFAPLPVDVVLAAGKRAKEEIGKNGWSLSFGCVKVIRDFTTSPLGVAQGLDLRPPIKMALSQLKKAPS